MIVPTFRKDPKDRRPLAEQLAALLGRSIRSGVFPEGSTLPSVREMAATFGVSHVVAWRALRALTEDGLVATRHSAGSVVLPHRGKVWRGRVLMVERDSAGSYYASVLADEVSRRLSDAGYILEREVLRRDDRGDYDFSRVELELENSVRLILQMHDDARISDFLSRYDVPLICIARHRTDIPTAIGVIRSNHLTSAAAVAEACRALSLRRVWQIGGWSQEAEAEVLRRAGLDVREFVFAPRKGGFELEETQRAALDGVNAFFAAGAPVWPDLIRLTDDFTAMGVLQGLLAHGVRIPDDVRVVTLSNRGFGPVFHRPLAREEMDPFVHGQAVADYVVAYLRTGRLPSPISLDSVYLPGESLSGEADVSTRKP